MAKKKSKALLHILTPFFLAAVCAGIAVVAAIKPADKLKTYTNVAFMDSLKSDPLSDDSGLVIKDNDITEEYNGTTSEEGEVVRPAFGEMYALIKCDSLGIDVPVYWGVTNELLEHGACQSSSSAVAGTEGNTVISAHVDTFFSDLTLLKEDDTVTLLTNYGKFEYKVVSLIEFASSDRKYVKSTDSDILTLYTCKRDLLGNSDIRTGVVCELTEKSFYSEKEGE